MVSAFPLLCVTPLCAWVCTCLFEIPLSVLLGVPPDVGLLGFHYGCYFFSFLLNNWPHLVLRLIFHWVSGKKVRNLPVSGILVFWPRLSINLSVLWSYALQTTLFTHRKCKT